MVTPNGVGGSPYTVVNGFANETYVDIQLEGQPRATNFTFTIRDAGSGTILNQQVIAGFAVGNSGNDDNVGFQSGSSSGDNREAIVRKFLLSTGTPPTGPQPFHHLTPYNRAVMCDNPRVYWTFDELLGYSRDQVGGHLLIPELTGTTGIPGAVGTVRGGATNTPGNVRLGRAAQFPPNADVLRYTSFPLEPGPSNTTSFIVEFWAKINASSNDSYLVRFGNQAPALVHGFNDGVMEFMTAAGGRTGPAGPTNLADGAWHHVVAGLFDGGNSDTHTFQIDNGPAVEYTSVTGVVVDLNRIVVGGGAVSNGLRGLVDELAVYTFETPPTKAQFDDRLARIARHYDVTNQTCLTFGYHKPGPGFGMADSRQVAVGDVDGDGDLDTVIANADTPSQVWLNDGHGLFSDSGQALSNTAASDVVLADFDLDGDLDAFFANGGVSTQNVPNTVWLNDGAGLFSDSGQILGNEADDRLVLFDVGNDGNLDVSAVSRLTSTRRTWINDGTGTFTAGPPSTPHPGLQDVVIADWTRLGFQGRLLSIIGQNRLLTATSAITFPPAPSHSAAAGDLNGDGVADTVMVHDNGGEIWINDDNGLGFSRIGFVTRAKGVALGDLNGDGHLDAALLEPGVRPIYLNDGTGDLTSTVPIGLSNSDLDGNDVALADYDQDGRLDLFVAHSFSGNRVWLGRCQLGIESFTPPVKDEGYYRNRPRIAVPRPGEANGALRLDSATTNVRFGAGFDGYF
ncbi:MAG: FG-GAP-like repeat-containing protein, partial [Verrucomicrobiota bacterium]